MDRRSFIKNTGLAAGAVSFLGTNAHAFPGLLSKASAEAKDRVLVLVYLNGGNDGLNTFVPIEIYDRLSEFRPDVIVPENQLLNLSETLAVHPSFEPLQALFEAGSLGVVRDVGYPEANLSHFRSREIVHTASASNEQLDDGWLGRHLTEELPEYPIGFPNTTSPDPIILSMSGNLSQISQGAMGNFNVSAGNPASKNNFDMDDLSDYEVENTRFAEELDFLRVSQQQTNDFKEVIYNRYQAGPDLGDTESSLTKQFKNIVRLIAGGSTTKVYIVQQGGYDTHGGQVEAGDTTSGKHSDLLADLANSIKVFQEDLTEQDLGDRVVGLTYTEFGRRITQNESLGTDHGHASTWFVFGEKVNPVIHGKTPTMPEEINNKANLAMQHDFRDVYYNLLVQWLGVPEAESAGFFGHGSSDITLIEPESALSTFELGSGMQIGPPFPNPVYEYSKIPLELQESSQVELSIYDMNGRQLRKIPQGQLSAGRHQLHFSRQKEARGRVVYKVQAGKNLLTGTLDLR